MAAVCDLAEKTAGIRLAPVELFASAVKTMNVAGTAAMTVDAIAALGMALWDASAMATRGSRAASTPSFPS